VNLPLINGEVDALEDFPVALGDLGVKIFDFEQCHIRFSQFS
jgi:hypothetical protein